MTEQRLAENSEVRIEAKLLWAILGVLLVAVATGAWWAATMETRVNHLEDEKCPCRDFFQEAPPRFQR